MSTGLIALLDDVASIAKVAAATLDDVAAQATRAGVKAAGVVIDDASVAPRYVVGFTADRELPIVRKIAVGSVRNKLVYLLPLALLLSALAPWLVYGGVALIVKADDLGVMLAAAKSPVTDLLGRKRASDAAPSRAIRFLQPITTALGRGLVRGMPVCLRVLGIVGTAAMLWVGGGIIMHGLEQYGLAAISHALEEVAHAVEQIVPALGASIVWALGAAGAAIVGLVLGSFLLLIVEHIGSPLWRWFRGVERKRILAR